MNSRRKLCITVAFDGTGFFGWQVQKDQRTIQGLLRDAILRITGEAPNLVGSGRTDAGTHARGLVASFETPSTIPARAMMRALNSILPHEIRVLNAREVPPEFDARRSSLRKTYRYQVYSGPVLPPHLAREHFHFPYRIDLRSMSEAAALLMGEHDFAAFAAAPGRTQKEQQKSTVRTIYRCDLKRTGFRVVLTVEGNGFLQHMVRNIMGTLLEIGRGRMKAEYIPQLLEKRDRTLAGFTAPARGLILVKVVY